MIKSEAGIRTDSAARVLAFGASILQGYYDNDRGGWVNRLRQHYDTLGLANNDVKQPTIFNLGVIGHTVEDIGKRIVNETGARHNPGEELVFIFSVGMNNAATDAAGIPKSTPENYSTALISLFKKARKFSPKILCVGLTPVDETRTQPVPWDPNTHYTNDRIKLFDQTMQTACEMQGALYVPVFEPFLANCNSGQSMFTLRDGLHPNGRAHKLIASIVLPKLDTLL